jgi:hypothetical protein
LTCRAPLFASLLPPFLPQIATVLALEKEGPAALNGVSPANAAAMAAVTAAGGIPHMVSIPTAYRR